MTDYPIDRLPAFDKEEGCLNVIIDTPKGSRNKFVYNFKHGLFTLSGTLTEGHYFPYDFGFVPHTVGGDDDSLDVLVLMDEPGFVGCWVQCRIIGGYQAMQTGRDGKTNSNDRFLAVHKGSALYENVGSMDDLPERVVNEIEHFFVSYNEARGRRFDVKKRLDAGEAEQLIRDAVTPERPTQQD